MKEILNYYNRIEYENSILESGNFQGRKLVIIGRSEKGEVLNPYLIQDEREAIHIFGHGELTQAFRESQDAGASLIYLLRIQYKTQQEKYLELEKAYEVLELIDVDIILPLDTCLDDYWYNYPAIPKGILVDFEIYGYQGENIVDSKQFPEDDNALIIDRDKPSQRITDKVVKDYFQNYQSGILKTYSFAESSELYELISKEKSQNYTVNDGILPTQYPTFISPDGRINEPKGYMPKADIITNIFYSDEIIPNSKITGLKVDVEGVFSTWRDTNRIDIYYYDGKKYIEVKNGEMVTLNNNLANTHFKFVLNNSNYIDPPIIRKIDITFKLTAQNNDLKFFIYNTHPYVNIWTKSDGSDYVYAFFNKEEYINKHTQKQYFVEQLAKACQKLNAIGIVKAPEKKSTESKGEWISRMLKAMEEIKEKLYSNYDYGKYIGCIVSRPYIYSNTGVYMTHGDTLLAGLISSLSSDVSPTNKDIPNINRLNYSFTNTELTQLTEAGYTVFIQTVRNGIVPYQFVSLANKEYNSIYASLNTTRIANEVIKRLKEITDEFIGKGFYMNTSTIEKRIKEELSLMIDENKISDYSYNFTNIHSNKIDLELSLVINSEVFDVIVSSSTS